MYYIEKIVRQKIEVRYLQVMAKPRSWENARVNGVEDSDGTLMPFINKEKTAWKPMIDLHEGIICNWPKGTYASVHYKVCDDGTYVLLDEHYDVVTCLRDEYVPSIMCPGGNGYGDYIIMDIDTDGEIINFKVELNAFQRKEDSK